MNNFCQVLTDSLRAEFEIEVERKKTTYVFDETINFL